MNRILVTDSKISGSVIRFKWIENNIYKIYIPSLEMSSYGSTSEEAIEMMNFSIKEFLFDLRSIKSELALTELGWEVNAGNFFHANIDKKEIIQNLNLWRWI